MISPSQTNVSLLCREVRSLRTLWGAWSSIRGRALASADLETRRDARDFDQNPAKRIRAIHENLRHDTFQFAPQRGVLKIRPGKKHRPIVVSPVQNRVVQRAILDVLQSDSNRISKRLGQIPGVLATPTSIGGIPGRGAPEAVALIREIISDGAKYYIRSDLIDFFAHVRKPMVLNFLLSETADHQFVLLVERALAVELSNAEEPKVRSWLDLFPLADEGVPQGSSLSTLCANILLRDIDAEFNDRGIRMVRYIDDFVMFSKNKHKLMQAWPAIDAKLGRLGLKAHSPWIGGAKASHGLISQGFDFLSYHFKDQQIGPSKMARQKLIATIQGEVSQAKRDIQKNTNQPRKTEARIVQVLDAIDKKVRGWGQSFKETNQRVQFAQLDRDIASIVGGFLNWHSKQSRFLDAKGKMRSLGVALLEDTPAN